MRKTNNVAFAHKLNLDTTKYNKNFFESNYHEGNLNKNICRFHDSDYWGVLVYDGEKNGTLFFKFGKIRAGDTQIIDLKTSKIKKSKLADWEKHIDISFLAYFPNRDILISLYNDDAMQYITSPLYRYFKEHIGEEIKCEILSRPIRHSDLNKLGMVHKIEIITAKQNYKFYQQGQEKNPFSRLGGYNESGTVKLIFSRLGKFDLKEMAKTIWDLKKDKDTKSLIIHGNNFEILNILKNINIWFPCVVKMEAGLPDMEDFKTKSLKVFEENEELLLGFIRPPQ